MADPGLNDKEFFNLYRHGFIRAAVCAPTVRVADPAFNLEETLRLAEDAARRQACLVLFPELGLSAYSNEDLFHQQALLEGVRDVLAALLAHTRNLDAIVVAGAPLEVDDLLYNCALVCHRGRILGIATKSYLPNYREFYEARQFSRAEDLGRRCVDLFGQAEIPIGADLIFEATDIPHFRLYVELCEDVWVPIPPSSFAALAGATVIANLSASNITVGKAEYRRALIANQSARCMAAYLYSGAGFGESTTDLAWDSHAMICENGNLLAESKRFATEAQTTVADIDLDRLALDRMRMNTFRQNARTHREAVRHFRRIPVEMGRPAGRIPLVREIPRFPYIPADLSRRDARCAEVYAIQSQGLAKRLAASGTEGVVIGISGGLDSTHALIVAAHTMDLLGRPRSAIYAYTMPAFATSRKTYSNALNLMRALGVESNEIDIRPSCLQMFKDIRHPYAGGKRVYDITFENVQAGERTSHLFRLANLRQAIVLGTGDLSELALGWCTYGVGDHMSHYNVNASLPKTLIQHVIRWVARSAQFGEEVGQILLDILETEISPELVPGEDSGEPSQKTEDAIGPYELQDFNNFYITRYGYRPAKVAFMAHAAWHDSKVGQWPDVPENRRHAYAIGEIRYWLKIYLHRFFKVSQFKRSCLPNGPKIGSGGSLSPRGDYRAPSDSEAVVWLADADRIPEREVQD